MQRLRDVLDLLFAEIFEGEIEPANGVLLCPR
jgi:hypothetical protein